MKGPKHDISRHYFAVSYHLCGISCRVRVYCCGGTDKGKNSRPSEPLKIVIDQLEKFREYRESRDREWIIAYDDAIAMIEDDIAEFKSFDVRKSGGPRVFQSQDRKDNVVQTLEKVRDGWNERRKWHETHLLHWGNIGAT